MDPFEKEDQKDYQRGSNVEVPLTLTFDEAYTGIYSILYTSDDLSTP
jgi:hypothetical protein